MGAGSLSMNNIIKYCNVIRFYNFSVDSIAAR